MAEATGSSYVLKAPASIISKHFVRNQKAEVGRTCSEVKIEPAVIIDVAKVRRHCEQNVIEPHLVSNVCERAIVVIPVETRKGSFGGKPQFIRHDFVQTCIAHEGRR